MGATNIIEDIVQNNSELIVSLKNNVKETDALQVSLTSLYSSQTEIQTIELNKEVIFYDVKPGLYILSVTNNNGIYETKKINVR